MDRIEHLKELAREASGLHYDSPEARAILDREDWSEFWPAINRDGELTGDIVDSDTPGEWANVDDEAMILLNDLAAEDRAQIRHEQRNCCWDGNVPAGSIAAHEPADMSQ